MARFIALYRTPEDDEAAARFEADYRATHLPLVLQTPGLVDVEVSRVSRTFVGAPLLLMAVMSFADEDSMKQAMRSPQWQSAGANLVEIEGMDLVTMATLDDSQTHRPDSSIAPDKGVSS